MQKQGIRVAERLEEWLSEAKLPELAETCIDNFVISCKQAGEGDILNFIYIDIRLFEPEVQDKLIEGFIYAYFGLKPAVYQPENMPECYKVYLN